MAIADITVLGGGIFGLSIAWEATRRGARVRLIERHHIGAGSSGGIVGALAPHTPENWNPKKQVQLDALLMAQDWWDGIASAGGGDPGYGRLGRVQTVADAAALDRARDRAGNAQTLWAGHAKWRIVPDSAHAGWAPSSGTGWLIHDTLSARLHPRHACEALAAALTARGAQVILGDAESRGLVIDATGAEGLAVLSADLGRPVGNGVKGQAALLAFDARDRPQLFLDGLHIVPHGDGTTAIGSTSERDFDDPRATDAQCEALIDRARALCPALARAPVIARWAGVRPRARSRAPILGAHPVAPGRYIANGGFKIGFGMAPMIARMMADLVLDGRDTIPPGFRVTDNL